MKSLFSFIAVLAVSSAAMAESIHCSKTVRSSDGTAVINSYSAPVVNDAALINLYTIGENGLDQQGDQFAVMARYANGAIDLVRVIARTDNSFAEIYSQNDMLAFQKGNFKVTVACQALP